MLPASSPVQGALESPSPLASPSIGLTCVVMRRDHQWLTPGPTASCIGAAHTYSQVFLGIPDCQVGPGPLHYQLTLQPGKAPIPH